MTLSKNDVLQQLDELAREARSLADDHDLSGYTIDDDAWPQDDEPAYTDPAEVIAVQAQQLANVRHALRSDSLTGAERHLLEEEQATLCHSIADELARAELLPGLFQ